MPDVLGRYNLRELREKTRRLMNGLKTPVNPLTGQETLVDGTINYPNIPPDPLTGAHTFVPAGPLDALFSNDDLNFLLNSNLTGEWIDATAADETSWEDEENKDVVADTLEIPFPDDLALLRGVDWLDPRQRGGFTIIPPSCWIPMHQWNHPGERLPIELRNGAPTFRRNVQGIVINEHEFVKVAVSQGIRFRYIKHMQPLTDEDQVIETQFARELQEVVMRATAIEGLTIKSQIDTSPLAGFLNLWRARLAVLVRNAYTPPQVQMVTRQPVLRRGLRRKVQ